jgi:signal transduction histidine kinase
MKKSMLRRLIANQLVVVVLFAVLTALNVLWQFYRDGVGDYDQHLRATAQALLDAVEPSHKQPDLMLREIAVVANFTRTVFAAEKTRNRLSNTNYQVVVRLFDASGAQLFQSPPQLRLPASSVESEISSFELNQQLWRSLTVRSAQSGLRLQLAETEDGAKNDMASIVLSYIVLPTVLFLPFAGLLTWAVARRGLLPLHTLAAMIARRTPHDMQALGSVEVYTETAPVVQEINALLERLRATIARERDFLADAAHELRTPLAVVQAQAHVMQHAADDAQRTQAAHELDAGVGRAAELINKLLVTARLSGDDFSPRLESVDLTALVQERVALLSSLASRKQIEMELKSTSRLEVSVDRETFVSAVDNVIDNAIRYTPNSGSILIEIAKEHDSRISLRVSDNGVGIPQELHERVFERFYRVNNSEQIGSGLGLAIVKRVLSLHGGKVTLSTGLDERGLAVALTLPIGFRTANV